MATAMALTVRAAPTNASFFILIFQQLRTAERAEISQRNKVNHPRTLVR